MKTWDKGQVVVIRVDELFLDVEYFYFIYG